MGQFFILCSRVQQEYNSLLVNALNHIFVRSKYYTPFYKTPMKWIPDSKSGASKSRPRWAAHTHIGNVWEYPPPPRAMGSPQVL